MDEEIEKRLQTLISRGELAVEEGRSLAEKLVRQPLPHLDDTWTDEAIEQALSRQGLLTRDDLRPILDQLDRLLAELEDRTRKPINQ